jgi:hypothetical protein
MAKMKTFMVEVEVTTKLLLFVEARKPGGAEEKIKTEEGWRDATSYHEDTPFRFDPKTMKVTSVREANV